MSWGSLSTHRQVVFELDALTIWMNNPSFEMLFPRFYQLIGSDNISILSIVHSNEDWISPFHSNLITL